MGFLIEAIDDGVGERYVRHHDVVALQVFAGFDEYFCGRDDDVGAVFSQAEGDLALFDAQWLHHLVEAFQLGKRQLFVGILAVACQFVELVDVAA